MQAVAKGDIFNSPTAFRFAKGSGFANGVMGEAGPEAVMLLRRGAAGRLVLAPAGGSKAERTARQRHNACRAKYERRDGAQSRRADRRWQATGVAAHRLRARALPTIDDHGFMPDHECNVQRCHALALGSRN